MTYRLTLLVAALAVVSACQTDMNARWRDEEPSSFRQIKEEILRYDPDLGEFTGKGPFEYEMQENAAFDLGQYGTILADVMIARGSGKAPLVIIAHGNRSAKEAHRYQAQQLASYGMHAMVLQLTNRSQWMKNGRIIASLVKRISKRPSFVSPKVDKNNIILAGHSFGGSAVTIAAGRGAPVKGLILLDPAVVTNRVTHYMRKVAEPTILLGADRTVYRARKQHQFFRNMSGEFGQISVRGATHDDLQHPSMFSIATLGVDPYTSETNQKLFSTALTASAFSLAATGTINWAWEAFRPESKRGRFASARRKSPTNSQ